MWEVYFPWPWPITVEIFMSDFQRFFYFRKRRKNKKTLKNVKKNVFYIYGRFVVYIGLLYNQLCDKYSDKSNRWRLELKP